MSENGEWRLQVNFKFGNHLMNLRAMDWAELMSLISNLPSNAPEILVAGASLEKPSAPPREPGEDFDENPAPAPPAPAPVQNQPGTEIGPGILKADVKTGVGKNQKPYTRYVATMGGITASTFDSLIGSIVLQLNGKQAFARVEKQGQFYNLISVRPAA